MAPPQHRADVSGGWGRRTDVDTGTSGRWGSRAADKRGRSVCFVLETPALDMEGSYMTGWGVVAVHIFAQ